MYSALSPSNKLLKYQNGRERERASKPGDLADIQTFSAAKSYISKGPLRVCGAVTLQSCQKRAEWKTLTGYFTAWAGAIGGIPAGPVGDAGREKSELSG